jgi:hypothetical protein
MQVGRKDAIWFLISIAAAIASFTAGWKTANWKRDKENEQQVAGSLLETFGSFLKSPQNMLKEVEGKELQV